MRSLLKHVLRFLTLLLVGGLIGACLVRFAPGLGMNEEMLDSRLNQASQESMRATQEDQVNLGRFFLDYCERLMRGDLGRSSAFNEPVRALLAERIPETTRTIAYGLSLAWTLGLGLAISSVTPGFRTIGRIAAVSSVALLCIPAAVLALCFVILQAPGRLAVGVIVFPKVFQFAHSLLSRTASMPHILTARAKGASELRVVFWHVIPVSLPQIIALIGVSVCMALAASIPVEVLCDLPGIGQLAWKAAQARDLSVLVILTMVVTAVTLLANTGSDLIGVAMRRREP